MWSVGGVVVTGKTWSTWGSTCECLYTPYFTLPGLGYQWQTPEPWHVQTDFTDDQYVEFALINSAFNAHSEFFHKIIIEGKLGW